jgi:DNA-binding LacI/PurR family transcriptional regulator
LTNEASRKTRPASIKEVARLAGVSVSTVSHVINDTRYVSEPTRLKVLESIARLKYRPNIMAQGIRGRKSRTIGLIVSNLSGSFFYRLVNAVCSYMHSQGYDVLVCNSEENVDNEKRHIGTLLRKGIDGLIYAPVDYRNSYEELSGRQVPFVQIERKNTNYGSDYVDIDNVGEAKRITTFLLDRGCRRIGFIRHGMENYTGRRFAGYEQTCSARGNYDPTLVINVTRDIDGATELIREWLHRIDSLDGLICTNANICFSVLCILEEIGQERFQNLKLFSFEENRWLSLLKFPLFALDQPIEEIGDTASRVLLERMAGDERPPRDFFLECRIAEHV